jgi:hypothetical protein
VCWHCCLLVGQLTLTAVHNTGSPPYNLTCCRTPTTSTEGAQPCTPHPLNASYQTSCPLHITPAHSKSSHRPCVVQPMHSLEHTTRRDGNIMPQIFLKKCPTPTTKLSTLAYYQEHVATRNHLEVATVSTSIEAPTRCNTEHGILCPSYSIHASTRRNN